MGDEAKSFLDLTIADLKTGADFDKAHPPGAADTPPAPDATPPAKSTPDAELIFEDVLGVGAKDDVIDIPYRESLNDLHQRIGGEQNFEEFDRKFDLANTIFDLDEELEDRPFASAAEYNEASVRLVKMVDAILADPKKAQMELDHFEARDFQDPVKQAFFAGDDDTVEMIYRLRQAAEGLPVTGRQKSRGDGFIR
jgi:hypothetical protein